MYIKVAQGQLQGAGVHPYHMNVADFMLPFSAHVILRHHKPGHYSLNVTVGYSMNSKQNKVFSLRLPVATCKSPARVNVNFVAIFSKSDFFCLEFYCVNIFFFKILN